MVKMRKITIDFDILIHFDTVAFKFAEISARYNRIQFTDNFFSFLYKNLKKKNSINFHHSTQK